MSIFAHHLYLLHNRILVITININGEVPTSRAELTAACVLRDSSISNFHNPSIYWQKTRSFALTFGILALVFVSEFSRSAAANSIQVITDSKARLQVRACRLENTVTETEMDYPLSATVFAKLMPFWTVADTRRYRALRKSCQWTTALDALRRVD